MDGPGLEACAGATCSVKGTVEYCVQLIDRVGIEGRGGVKHVEMALGGGDTVDGAE